MNIQLTQKETDLLKDLKEQQKLGMDKYNKHAAAAVDGQLKNLFTRFAQVEQQHLDTIMQLQSGTVSQPSSCGQNMQQTFTATYNTAQTPDKQNDSYLCSDVLAMEKQTSHLYDTCIFEFSDENARNLLNCIQKNAQNHGKMIYDYMSTNNMYS